jgi:hypothetical protein
MKRQAALLVLAGLAGLAGTARADETTLCNTFITAVPFTISTQGHYCFNRNLSTAMTSGSAITINVDYVVLDLNNFKLGGGSAGLSTTAVGVFSMNHRNLTIRNGNIRGFKIGVELIGASAGNLLIENNVLDGNTYRGAETDGDSSVVRNNLVTNTGGSTNPTEWTYGVYADYSDTSTGTTGLTVARDNVVSNTFDNGAYGSVGLAAGVADHNIVSLGNTTGSNSGMWAKVCRDNTVLTAGATGTPTPYNSCNNFVGSNFP